MSPRPWHILLAVLAASLLTMAAARAASALFDTSPATIAARSLDNDSDCCGDHCCCCKSPDPSPVQPSRACEASTCPANQAGQHPFTPAPSRDGLAQAIAALALHATAGTDMTPPALRWRVSNVPSAPIKPHGIGLITLTNARLT